MIHDLYKTLGVEPTADNETIKRAFRALVIIHHPDKNDGVRTPEFDEIKRAYDTLNDDHARQQYDEFGVVPGDEESTTQLQAVTALVNVFSDIIMNHIDVLDHFDLIDRMRGKVKLSKKEIKNNIEQLEKHLVKLHKALAVVKKRLRKRTGGNDFLTRSIESGIAQIPQSMARGKKQLDLHDTMLKLLDEYEYEPEKMEQLTKPVQTFSYIWANNVS